MKIEARYNGQISFEITAETASDRAALGMFDEMNSGKRDRRITCGSGYSCNFSAVNSLCISATDMPQPPQNYHVSFWKWLGFHVHDWTNWTTLGEVVIKDRVIGYFQTRDCESCKKKQIRRVIP